MLQEREWQILLDEINGQHVVPVVGPQLVSVAGPDGDRIPLGRWIAPRVAESLGLSGPESFRSSNDVARAYLLAGNSRRELYSSVRQILKRLDLPPSPALLDLAGITDFRLFIAATPDPLLARAVAARRPDFVPDRGVVRFHPRGAARGHDLPVSGDVAAPCDIPAAFAGPLVYHILGDYQTFPDFVVWEEDYMEFLCGLIENRPTLTNLFSILKTRSLLLLGAPSDDWVVRFFLRAARGQRPSETEQWSYLADRRADLSEPLIFYFDKAVRATRIIDGEPAAFVAELAARWRAAYGESDDPDAFLERLPETMPRRSVFISYARDDLATAARVAHTLSSRGVPVWLDRQRLEPGRDFATSLEHVIKDDASFFVSLISRHTEADPGRYVHQERAWAAQKHVAGFVYYLPLVIDDTPDAEIRLEPACFARIHRERAEAGGLDRFANRVRDFYDEYRDSGRPRG